MFNPDSVMDAVAAEASPVAAGVESLETATNIVARPQISAADERWLRDLMTSDAGKAIRTALPVLQPWCSIMAQSTNAFSIDASGDVTTCCYDSEMANKVGNVYEDGLREVWRRFNAVLLGDLYEKPLCQKCIGSGTSYAPPVVCRDRDTLANAYRLDIPEFPKRIITEPAALCNYACEGCPANWNAKVMADLERLYNGLSEGLPHIEFMAFGLYGEPLLNKALPEFFVRCRATAPQMVMQLLTNGTPLTERVAHKIVDADVDIVTMAIHAGPFTENMLKYSVRGANYPLVLANLKKLIEIRNARPNSRTTIEVRTVLFNWNDTDELMQQLRDDVAAAGIDSTIVPPNRARDRLYWVLDVAGPDAPRASKRFLAGNAEVQKLRSQREFGDV
jgi:radical SAM protein with 4Fe4S-binding SPASM domain